MSRTEQRSDDLLDRHFNRGLLAQRLLALADSDGDVGDDGELEGLDFGHEPFEDRCRRADAFDIACEREDERW